MDNNFQYINELSKLINNKIEEFQNKVNHIDSIISRFHNDLHDLMSKVSQLTNQKANEKEMREVKTKQSNFQYKIDEINRKINLLQEKTHALETQSHEKYMPIIKAISKTYSDMKFSSVIKLLRNNPNSTAYRPNWHDRICCNTNGEIVWQDDAGSYLLEIADFDAEDWIVKQVVS